MTFAILRDLHAIIGDALDDIQHIYTDPNSIPNPRSPSDTPSPTPSPSPTTPSSPFYPNINTGTGHGLGTPFPFKTKVNGAYGLGYPHAYTSPPPSPSVPPYPQSRIPSTPPSHPTTPHNPQQQHSAGPLLDFPSLDAPYSPTSPAEVLTTHPTVVAAISRIVAAAGQLTATVQAPFLSLCDASMGYHLPSCMRLLEATHTVEILREAGPKGLHVKKIAERNGTDPSKLAHVLRLLATHHILREVSPDVFANNRISSLVDSGKDSRTLVGLGATPEKKYEDTNGIAAFVGLNTDELFKSSAYLTEAYHLSPQTKHSREPTHTPFNFAFGTEAGFFGWLEGEDINVNPTGGPLGLGAELGPGSKHASSLLLPKGRIQGFSGKCDPETGKNWNRHRLERFGKAMLGTGSWEAPGAVLNGFDWASLSPGSIIVDVGGGIGSTSMLLAEACAGAVNEDGVELGLRFVVQDRPVVVEMGEKAWRARCPELLDSGTARFQVHDFFTPQPIKNASVFLLRVVLHDWPDAFAQRILLRLREAATDKTKLVIADFVLPLACVDDFGVGENGGNGDADGVEGAQRMLAPAPLLANLGKASANAYWMDLTMQVTFNSQERTLREIVKLALSAGWKVVKVTRAAGSLFGHIVAVPVPIPVQKRARAGSGSAFFDVGLGPGAGAAAAEQEIVDAASSRCGTPTFGSRVELPSVEEALARFGGGVVGRGRKSFGVGARPGVLKQAAVVTTGGATAVPGKKKKPSPLSVLPPPSPSPASYRPLASPRQPHGHLPPISRQKSQPHLYRHAQAQASSPIPQSPTLAYQTPLMPPRQIPPLPNLHRQTPPSPTLSRHALLQSPIIPRPPPPSPRHPPITRRLSYATLPQSGARRRAGSVLGGGGIGVGGGIAMGSLMMDANHDKLGGEGEVENEIGVAGGTVLAAAARIEKGLPKAPLP